MASGRRHTTTVVGSLQLSHLTSVVLCADLQHVCEQLHCLLQVVSLFAVQVGRGGVRKAMQYATGSGGGNCWRWRATLSPGFPSRPLLTSTQHLPLTLMHWMPRSNLRWASASTSCGTAPVPAPLGPASSFILVGSCCVVPSST